MGDLYSVTEIAKLIGVTPETVKHWEQSQLIPQSSRMGRQRKRVWGKAKVILIVRFARDLSYPVPSEDEFINGRYLTKEAI